MHVLIEQSHLFIIRSGYKKQRNEIMNSTGNSKKVKLFCLLQRDCLLLIKSEVAHQIGFASNLLAYKQIIATAK